MKAIKAKSIMKTTKRHLFTRENRTRVPKHLYKWKKITPAFSKPINIGEGSLVAFKCPMDEKFDPHLSKSQRLLPVDVVAYYHTMHHLELKHVIDITNTDKYYNEFDD